MSADKDYANRLLLSDVLREPAIRAAIAYLRLPPGSRGLDVGCGVGLHTPLLARAAAPNSFVIGLDRSSDFLALAEERAEKLGSSGQVCFQQGDMICLPFDDETFDWVWSVDTLHPGMFSDPRQPIHEIIRVLKPGGRIALLYWSSQTLLPGYPALEAHLDATFAQAAPYTKDIPPQLHFSRALGWLRDMGLHDLFARTFVADVYAPLSEQQRGALAMTFQMFWGWLQTTLPLEDWAEFERLCQPESPDFILDRPDYHAFLTYTCFTALQVRGLGARR